MAVRFFSPTATDASSTSAYLDAPDGSSIGSLPTSGDTLVFAGGSNAITAGHAALAAIDFAKVIVLETCFKACDTPLQLMVSHSGGPGSLLYQGSGSVFKIMADGDGIDDARVECNGGRFELSSDSTSTTAKLIATRGQVKVAATGRLTTWVNAGANLEIVDSANTYTLGVNRSGTVVDYRGGARLRVPGGLAVAMVDAAYSTEVEVFGGDFNARTTGTIAKLSGYSGRAHPSNAPGDVPVTNTDLYEGFQIFSDAGGSAFNFANAPVYYGNVALQKSSKVVPVSVPSGSSV